MLLKVFVSYSHKDAAHQQRLAVHLAPLVRDGLSIFYDGDITPGADIDAEVRRELRNASVFVALASPDYLQSEYCFIKEYGYARRRAARKTMFVVAVILRPCGWKATRMARYKSLPRNGKEVTRWINRDAAFEDVVRGLRRVVADAEAIEKSTPSKPSKQAARARRAKTIRAPLKSTAAEAPRSRRLASSRKVADKARAPRHKTVSTPAPAKSRVRTARAKGTGRRKPRRE